MKKTLLAAALTLGFAGIAQAETSVTLYGVIDAGLAYEQVKGNTSYASNRDNNGANFKATRTGLNDGTNTGAMGSRWGLKGVEDLGDGLRVVFQLESGFSTMTGNSGQGGRLFGRHATVGLAGDSWGQVDFGRQTNIASKYMAGIADPFGGSFGMAAMGNSFTAMNTHRVDNMILYQTPNFSGFQFGAGYSFSANGDDAYKISTDFDATSDGSNPNSRAITAGIRYANGPIGVALTYDQEKVVGFKQIGGFTVPGREGKYNKKSWALAGSYDFEVVKIHAAFGQTRNGLFSGGTYDNLGVNAGFVDSTSGASILGEGFKANSFGLGVSAPIGNGKVMASWHMADPRSASDNFKTAYDVNNLNQDYDLKKQQTYSLGYSYNMSKRTSLYVVGSYAKNVTFRPDAKATLLTAGMTHRF